jgi:hypothetical protein
MTESGLTTKLKQAMIERAQGCCEYCRSQAKFAIQAFSVEHIIPRSRGGRSTIDNLALACQGCNNHKYMKIEGVDPITGETVPLFHPRKHNWNDHFAWDKDFSFMLGITPIGRATVDALKLNRWGLVNFRRILFVSGEHPPEGVALS